MGVCGILCNYMDDKEGFSVRYFAKRVVKKVLELGGKERYEK